MTTFSVCLGGAIAPNATAVAVEMAHLTLDKETDKAVYLADAVGRRCWFPKKAFVRGTAPDGKPSDWWKIARWFRLDPRQEKFLRSAAFVSGVSVN